MKYLTFDCYGTLIDWRAGIERELVSAFGELPVAGAGLLDAYIAAEKEEEGSYKKYRQVLESTSLALAKKFGKPARVSAAEEFAASVPSWPAFPDTADTLRALGKMGYKRYILSNVDTDLLLGTIETHGLEVDGFVTAEEAGSYKPQPGHWTAFMQKTGARKDGIIHVAQSIYHDIIPTQAMGIQSVWVNRYAERLPPDAAPACIVDNMDAVTRVLGPKGEGILSP